MTIDKLGDHQNLRTKRPLKKGCITKTLHNIIKFSWCPPKNKAFNKQFNGKIKKHNFKYLLNFVIEFYKVLTKVNLKCTEKQLLSIY